MKDKKKDEGSGTIPPPPSDRWTIDPNKCTMCTECVDACSDGLLEVKDNRITMRNEKLCNQCGDCVAVCGYYAIVLT